MNDTINQRQGANFVEDGQLYLVRCYACEPERGRENYAPAVATGTCAWCGWGNNRVTENGEVPLPPTSHDD